jgi:hypothetical protein
MRTTVVVAVALALAAPASAARIAFLHHGSLAVVDPATGASHIVLRGAGAGPVAWSGDGRRLSVGGRVVGGPTLAAARLVWAPSGERAAFVTRRGGVEIWSPAGTRRVLPDGWGAQSVAWRGKDGLEIGRAVCGAACGLPAQLGIWTWDRGGLRRLLALPRGAGVPLPFGWDGRRVLWWAWPNSGSIAADGVMVFAGRTRLAQMLMYPDWVARCGARLALAVGRDRNSMHGKRILLGGRDVSRDATRSWVAPSCSADGSTLVTSAGREDGRGPWGREHRAIWQLLPTRRQLTHPPSGWTDERPQLLRDGSLVFVRTRYGERAQTAVVHAWLERLAGGRVHRLADLDETVDELSATPMYYGHYWWPDRLAVAD